MGAWIRAGNGVNTCTIKDEWVITAQEIIAQAVKALEAAPPAAERTELKAKIQELRNRTGEPDNLRGIAFVPSFRKGIAYACDEILAEIDAASASEGTKSE